MDSKIDKEVKHGTANLRLKVDGGEQILERRLVGISRKEDRQILTVGEPRATMREKMMKVLSWLLITRLACFAMLHYRVCYIQCSLSPFVLSSKMAVIVLKAQSTSQPSPSQRQYDCIRSAKQGRREHYTQ